MHLQLGMTQGRNLRSSPTCICVHPGSQSHLYPGSPVVTVQFPFPHATALHSDPARVNQAKLVGNVGKQGGEKKRARRLTHDRGEEGAERGEEVGDRDSGGGGRKEQHQRGGDGERSHLGFLISFPTLPQLSALLQLQGAPH